ncbi:MAG: TatD family hydrolase [Lachnospiraceae bacterium]|nr:TatD family hydrolase [Lachnospiraceae bacterium]
MIFDTHAHYDDDAFDTDREELLSSLSAAGIGAVVNIGASLSTTANSLALSEKYPWMYAAVGVHPYDIGELTEDGLRWLEEVSRRDKVVAVGEIGLDYHYENIDRDLQKHWFEQQLLLAGRVDKPVVIHTRDAAQDTLDMMKSDAAKGLGGIIHCFPFGAELAREYLNMGYYLGIGGVLTFKNGKKTKEAVAYAPLERIVLETDCPYLAPTPFRGKRNDSTLLKLVVKEVAQIKGVTEEEVERVTWENARRVYRLADGMLF